MPDNPDTGSMQIIRPNVPPLAPNPAPQMGTYKDQRNEIFRSKIQRRTR